ncbi:MAG: archaetidylserine decarboxylase [Gemmatimonadota bacterium]
MNSVPEVSPTVPPRGWRLVLRMLGRLPQRGLSRAFGALADLPLPRPARVPVLRAFARSVGIDISEVERPLEEYATLNDFFVRRLRPGVRRWPDEPDALASPVDGIVGRSGTVESGVAIQAKGHTYSVADLLADPEEASRFEGGVFLTLYLSPRHYHRIHTPAAGTIPRATYVPGRLLPVNEPAVMHVPGLFVRNERLVCYLDVGRGRTAIVAVGAYNVGRISASFDPGWAGAGRGPSVTNRRPTAPPERRYDPPRPVAAGDEIMAFHLGSTVVLLFEPGVRLRSGLRPGAELQVGEALEA